MGTHVEITRGLFRPDDVNVLFVGESPPAQGTFFYDGNSNLAKHTRRAFEAVFGDCDSPSTFLMAFKSCGFFLVDLCDEPVDDQPDRTRSALCGEGMARLAAQVEALRPKAVVAVKKSIAQQVNSALGRLNDVSFFVLPFPASGHQNEYVDGLVAILDQLGYRADPDC